MMTQRWFHLLGRGLESVAHLLGVVHPGDLERAVNTFVYTEENEPALGIRECAEGRDDTGR